MSACPTIKRTTINPNQWFNTAVGWANMTVNPDVVVPAGVRCINVDNNQFADGNGSLLISQLTFAAGLLTANQTQNAESARNYFAGVEKFGTAALKNIGDFVSTMASAGSMATMLGFDWITDPDWILWNIVSPPFKFPKVQ